MNNKINPLVGKVLKDMQLSDDKEVIAFVLSDNTVIKAYCHADCCSYTWIESVMNGESAIGSEILEADNIEMPDLGDMPERDVVSYYGFKIKTVKGECIIDFRNDSNGYYGGDLVWPGDYGYESLTNHYN